MISRAQDNLFYPEASQAGFSMPLHAMRGIASLIVLLLHIQNGVTENLLGGRYATPFNGMTAVTFFFVLSGLVLGSSIAKKDITVPEYIRYGFRRFFRIWPLLAFTATVGGAYVYYIAPSMPFHFMNPRGEFTVLKWISGYVGYSMKPNPPIWSLFVEIIASALLPFMILAGRKKSWLIGAGVFFFIFACLPLGLHNYWNFFMLDFFMGASILLWGRAFSQKLAAFPPVKFWAVIGAIFMVFYIPRIILAYDYDANFFHLFEMFFIVGFVAVVFFLPERFRFFNRGVFQYLGDISYSLYLTHSITLIALANIFAQVPFMMEHRFIFSGVFVLAGIPVSLAIAHLTYHYIEIPGIRLGKRFVKV